MAKATWKTYDWKAVRSPILIHPPFTRWNPYHSEMYSTITWKERKEDRQGICPCLVGRCIDTKAGLTAPPEHKGEER